MMGWLDRLKNETPPDPHAREPRQPPQGEEKTGFLGLLAYPPAPFEKSEAPEPLTEPMPMTAANDPAPARDAVQDPDRWNWPNSPAMNAAEVDTFTARLARFTDKGLIVPVAEALADGLVIRDREADDRRLCLECAHLQGFNHWRCANWQQAEMAREGLARDLVTMLQRCPGFKEATP